jgi:hypothetical protein
VSLKKRKLPTRGSFLGVKDSELSSDLTAPTANQARAQKSGAKQQQRAGLGNGDRAAGADPLEEMDINIQ